MTCKPNVDVTLTPQKNSAGQVKWQMEICSSGKTGTYGSYPELHVPKAAAPTDAHLVYLINNPPGYDWMFVPDAGALWVTSQPQDPKAPSNDAHVPSNSIHTQNPNPPDPSTANTQLSFTDHNNDKVPITLHYTLNFVDKSGHTSTTLDPIISNGGCCTRTYVNYVWYAIGAVAVIVILVLAARSFRRPTA